MPNRNYINGRGKEYRIIKKKLSEGFDYSFRSAGSHSPIDVVAINTKTKVIELIQSKPKSMSDNKKNQIEQDNIELNGDFNVKFYVA